MKDLNFTNKLYIVLLMLLFVATVFKILNYKGWDRYYYGASFSAPSSYPVYIREGYFLSANGESRYINTETVNYRNGDWGEGGYDSPTKKERLPEKLILQYASYRDSSFFTDTINLPIKATQEAFQKISTDGIETNLYGSAAAKRLDFVVGIANKGNIIVWLRSENREITLLKQTIKPHEPTGDETYYAGRLSKEAYLKAVFHIDSATKVSFDRGLDVQANYIDTPSNFRKLLSN